ncbi:hypothetical protein EDB81DRAFT_899531 [Dactylonectria macrodidyma]|uniref:Myb-like domain-containing protein n=1 Tax=Dactylonectria macrodidyma TaxID=307937 RepID=A0A9P9EQP1_9HYPO|nr:hypothetical protein EDB81DRAFT_899531 [Dactylonectria macrodidyma]
MPQDPSGPVPVSESTPTSRPSHNPNCGMQGDQEYYTHTPGGDVTEAVSDDSDDDTDDDSYHAPRIWRKARRSSARLRCRSYTANPSALGGSHTSAHSIPSRLPSCNTHSNGEIQAPVSTFQEWHLENATFERVDIDGQAFFQIQFGWDPRISNHPATDGSSNTIHRSSTSKQAHRGLRRAMRFALTPEEDDLLINLKERQDGLTWSEIHSRFNDAFPRRRPRGSLQVHYCKLKDCNEVESSVVLSQDRPTAGPCQSLRNIRYREYKDDSNGLGESGGSAEGSDCFTVERLLVRTDNGDFPVLWPEGTTTWEPRSNILDKEMLDEFEKGYRDYDDGVDILNTRTISSVRQYLLH